jgi:Cft2 family RNA processing exonuclease
VLIPTFALGRTQEMLGQLACWMETGELEPRPVFIGGLGRVFSEIYDLQSHRTNRRLSTLQLHEALELVVMEHGQAESMSLKGGHLFVVTAGMLTEHTAAHDLAVRLMREPQHAICFVGYADPDTPGGRLKVSEPGTPFRFSPSAGECVRRCELADFDLTAHANREELLDLVGQVNPRTVMLGHGSDESRAWFAEAIHQRHPRIRILQPGPGETAES